MNKHKRSLHNQSLLPFFVFGLLVQLFFSSTLFANSSNELLPPTIKPALVLTADEQVWLDAHPIITMGSGIHPPLNFIDEHGKSIGITPDYFKLIAARLGIKINMVSGDWPEIQALAKEQKLDGISALLKNSDRQEYLDFVGPYAQLQYAILVNKEAQGITNLDDLSDKRVGIMAGDYAHSFLKKNHADIDLVLYKTYEEALLALVNREIEAVVGSLPIVATLINKHLITGLKVAGFPDCMENELYAAVRKDWPQFAAILNKAFASISPQEHQKNRRKWISLCPSTDKIIQLPLTLKQKEWLAQQHNVRIWVSNMPPYMKVTKGRPPEGIAIDYLSLITQRTGIKFSYQVIDRPFSELLENMKQGQYFDLVPIIVPRRERQAYMLFSDHYIESPTVIAIRNDSVFITDIQGLTGNLVGVLKASNVQNLLSQQYPNITLLLYDSNELALEALAKGRIDAFVGSLTNAAHIIQERGFSNIHIIATSSLESEYFAMGNRKDWPELTAIINLALASISEKEKTIIRKKYVAVKYEVQGISPVEVLMWLVAVICVALIIVLFFITWNRSLRKLVDSRTVDLQLEIVEREQAHNALSESQKESLKTQKIARLGYWEWDIVSNNIIWSEEIYQILGLPHSTDLSFQNIMQLIHPDDHQAIKENNARWLQHQDGDIYEYRVIKSDGSSCFVSAIAEVELNDNGEVSRLFGTIQDVSERKKIELKMDTYQERLKLLASQLAIVEEQERRRIAADLHDNVGQTLALTRLQLAAVLKRLPDDKKTAELVRHCSKLILTVIQNTRHLIFEISSPSLNEFGLAAAIIELKEQLCKQNHSLEVEIIDRLKIDFVSLEIRSILFRNVRELLINVIKHAEATVVVITLEEISGSYMLTVKDNGIGFIVDELAANISIDGGFGLFSIQERMEDLGGQLLINSKLKEGCTISLTLPVIEMGTQ
jgi:PAS domain S-box-containing protein